MNKYTYKVTGNYKDWLEMKKGNIIIHNGSLIGFLSYNNKLEIRLNYGSNKYYFSEIKTLNNIVVTVPVDALLGNDYIYIPLAFNSNEYKELIDISYIDKSLLKNIKAADQKDIFNILLNIFRKTFNINSYLEFSTIIDSIIVFSENDKEIKRFIENFNNKQNINLRQSNNGKVITAFIDLNGVLYEWDIIVRLDNNFYFKFIDDYLLQIN